MRKAKRTLLAAACACALVVGAVAGTVAYLTATTGTVTNTFTVGNVSFALGNGLDEAKVDEYGELLDDEGVVYKENNDQTLADRVTANSYKLVPGHAYVKDPTVHMSADTEDAWLFVKVDNGISGIEATGSTTIAKQMETLGWSLVGGYTNLYQYSTKVSASADIKVFESFTVASTATETSLKAVKDAKIVVKACAVQADGLTQALAAAEAAEQLSATKAPVADPEA